MEDIDFTHPIHIHFIGIGGISMSGLAHILLDKGFVISGSDRAPSPLTQKLEKMGCRIHYPQAAENIEPGTDLIVYTAAIHPDNPEFKAALASGIPMATRAELLGSMMKQYRYSINVAGTHGKTTTTSMVSEILMAAGADPTLSIGGILDSIGSNVRVGKSDIFVAEACEYTNSFLSFFPTTSIILNVRPDHLDFFKNLDNIRASFREFARRLPDDGNLIINTDIENWTYFTEGLKCHVITFGSDPAVSDYSAKDITFGHDGCCSYTLLYKGKPGTRISLRVPGSHNVLNSLAAIAAVRQMNISDEAIQKGISNFTGAERRFQHKGVYHGAHVIDDYAHHPDEIKATLDTAAHVPHREIWLVFQPHLYSRTKLLMDQFADVMANDADHVILAKIYAARETDNLGISSQTLADAVNARGGDARYIDTFEGIEKFLSELPLDNDLLITMGAGNVYQIGDALLSGTK